MALEWSDVTPHPYDVMSFELSRQRVSHRAVERAVWTRRFAGSNLSERPSRTCNEKCSKRTVQDRPDILYDELEGKLRALESFGRTQEKYGDFLIPLVESCLPEETLLAYERSRNHESTQNTSSLEHLMNFLRKEVQGEEMVQLARTGFGPQHNFRKNNAPVECVTQNELATASALVSLDSELHVFVDAAGGAYAACVFVRSIIDSKVNIVLARAKKSRVAPLSIPRLELMAYNIGVRLVNSLMKALNFPNLKITFWSDSTTALWWIKEQGNWSVFVSNRVKEIRLLTKTHSWKHVPGNMNPADLLSRGCSTYKLLKSKWWKGPAWLKENPENWPTGEIIDQPSEIDIERKKIKIVNIDLANDAPLLWHLHNISNYSKVSIISVRLDFEIYQ
ncbi:integrase catalytic domain-containing protein [Trichonephila inaurata madagascariensis]|uniref:Integrase catalytic domain-containing protein n=1 Tax=Trichonephila inaurata madagascariensis TaxID=2747483 RepID=A0A8X6I5D6_9ARAC|nr:integrase catalytic domain-containing protein [Trichonephila inaurata madagascariensis]